MADESRSENAIWEDLHRLVQLTNCTLYHKFGVHVVIAQNIETASVVEVRDEPFLRMFSDDEEGYIAARSALLERFPYVRDVTIVCAKCGESKPLEEYDARFIGKPVKKVCIACRTLPRPEPKWLVAERAAQERHAAFENIRQEYEDKYPRQNRRFRLCTSIEQLEETARVIDLGIAKLEAWIQHCRSLGFDDSDLQRVIDVHFALHVGGRSRSWADTKSAFCELDPPYIGRLERRNRRLSTQERATLYERQEGRCAYCACELLPLNYRELPQRTAHYEDIPGFLGSIPYDGMVMLDRGRIPQIEHRLPVTRGGKDDMDNLCYACRKCNQRKDVRTVEEFAAMPEDAITRLDLPPQTIMNGLLCEQRGYERFDDPDAKLAARNLMRYGWPS